MRYLPHVAIAVAAVACAAIAYYALSGRNPAHQAAPGATQNGYSENSYCRVVSFTGGAKNGTASVCLRCVTGTYTATAWTNCPVRQSQDHPGSVECGYNAGQIPTAIDPGTMCAETGGGQLASAGGSQSTPPVSQSIPNINNGAPTGGGQLASAGGGQPAPTGNGQPTPTDGGQSAPLVGASAPAINSGVPSGGGMVPGTGGGQSAPTVGPNNPNIISVAPNGGGMTASINRRRSRLTGGGYLGVAISRRQSGPARVARVIPSGAGAITGIRPGDFIQSIQGTPINTGQDVFDILARFHPRDRVRLVVLRGGQAYSVNVVLGRRPAPNAGGPTSTRGADSGDTYTGGAADLVRSFGQAEQRDAGGRIIREAATINIVACNGQQFYIYEYLNRPGARAIRPPDWSHPVGGRDFETYEEALHAACQ